MMVYGDYLREVGYAAQKIGLTWDNVSDAVVCPSRQATSRTRRVSCRLLYLGARHSGVAFVRWDA